MTQAVTVLILSSQPLFAESLSSVFERDGYSVLGVGPYEQYIPKFAERMQPDLVVVDTEGAPDQAVADLLTCVPAARVLRVSLNQQQMSLYDRQQPVSLTPDNFVNYVAFREKWQAEAFKLAAPGGEAPQASQDSPASSHTVPERYLFRSEDSLHINFGTHANEVLMTHAESESSEALLVIVEPGQAVPRHAHPDKEQVFYLLQGQGVLTIGPDDEKQFSAKAGDLLRVPRNTLHSVRCTGDETLTYLAVDSYITKA